MYRLQINNLEKFILHPAEGKPQTSKAGQFNRVVISIAVVTITKLRL